MRTVMHGVSSEKMTLPLWQWAEMEPLITTKMQALEAAGEVQGAEYLALSALLIAIRRVSSTRLRGGEMLPGETPVTLNVFAPLNLEVWGG